ncbi:MAG: hypothetical protein WD065_00615, partial [Planctomycetaceae bacterium]
TTNQPATEYLIHCRVGYNTISVHRDFPLNLRHFQQAQPVVLESQASQQGKPKRHEGRETILAAMQHNDNRQTEGGGRTTVACCLVLLWSIEYICTSQVKPVGFTFKERFDHASWVEN